MRLGLMQPYFFPYPCHFSLISHTDEWIVFDTSQYTPQRWMNRNRVLSERGGCAWLTVPVRSVSSQTATADVILDDLDRARRRILGRLVHYRHRAPNYKPVTEMVDGVLAAEGDGTLVDLNVRSLEAVCAYLGLSFEPRRLSRMGLMLPQITHAGGWAPSISAAVGASSYLNPIGGSHIFDPQEFADLGIDLCFCDCGPMEYRTDPYPFEPGLSIIDALMWCSPGQVVDHLNQASIRSAVETVCRSHVA